MQTINYPKETKQVKEKVQPNGSTNPSDLGYRYKIEPPTRKQRIKVLCVAAAGDQKLFYVMSENENV